MSEFTDLATRRKIESEMCVRYFTQHKMSRRAIEQKTGINYHHVCRYIKEALGKHRSCGQGMTRSPRTPSAPLARRPRPQPKRFQDLSPTSQARRRKILERTHAERDQEGITIGEAQERHPKDGKRFIAWCWRQPAGYTFDPDTPTNENIDSPIADAPPQQPEESPVQATLFGDDAPPRLAVDADMSLLNRIEIDITAATRITVERGKLVIDYPPAPDDDGPASP